MKLKRQDTFTLKDPISLRTASRRSGIKYQALRKRIVRGAAPFRVQQLGGWFWFVERIDFQRWLAERRQKLTERRRRRRVA